MDEKELQSDKEIAKEIFLHLTGSDKGILAPRIVRAESPADEACAIYAKILKTVKEG
jgi:hypothetical protein